MKGIYENSTRKQTVEVLSAEGSRDVFYRVINGNETNSIREFVCTKERFKNLYIKQR